MICKDCPNYTEDKKCMNFQLSGNKMGDLFTPPNSRYSCIKDFQNQVKELERLRLSIPKQIKLLNKKIKRFEIMLDPANKDIPYNELIKKFKGVF